MALIKADRVKETSTSTGTGNFTLAGAATGFRTFASVCAVNDTVFYVIDSDSGSEWETGLGTYSATNTLTRTTVHASSNANAAVNFSAGTKNVYISQTARQINTISAAPPAATGAPARLEELTGAAHTALTASTEYSDIYWNLARTVQFSTGAITAQRAVRIAAPTYSFVGASTITNAVNVEIDGSPIAGTNATLTNSIALRVKGSGATGIPLVVQAGSSSPSANIQEWRSPSFLMSYIDSAYRFYLVGGGAGIPVNSRLQVGPEVGGFAGVGVLIGYSAGYDAISYYGSSSSKVFAVRDSGAIQPATLADSAAANNSIYYSSTAGKLVYKDSAGTVNNLY